MRKSGSLGKKCGDLVGVILGLGLKRGDEEKWFRKENVPGKLFIVELEGFPASP